MGLKNKIYNLLGYKTRNELLQELAEGKRTKIKGRDLKRAFKLELSSDNDETPLPQTGQIYSANSEFSVTYITHWKAPATGSGQCSLPRGEHIIIAGQAEYDPPVMFCIPIRYEELEPALIPEHIRNDENYTGYSFTISTDELARVFSITRG